MKKASRFMPKYNQPKYNVFQIILGTVVTLLITGSLIYFVSGTPFLLAVIAIISVSLYLQNRKTKKKFLLLAEERKELSICEFSRSFDTKRIDTWVLRAVYEQLQEYVPKTPIKADDLLFELLEIDEEDLEFGLVEEIAQRTGRSLENTESNKFYGNVKTVKDLVSFINEQPLIK